ncbi:response regulator [Inquilinus sp. KBS0705]|nr:response regulator [Inquilinus sp. KBS0705]
MRTKAFFCTVLTLIICSLTTYGYTPPKALPVVKNGLIDLRDQNFAEPIELNGQWAFYWKQLIDPLKPINKSGTLVTFPKLWTNYKVNGKDLPAFGYASYTLTVLLPHKKPALRMAMPDVYCSYKLFVNGVLAASNGKVSTSPKGFEPYWEYNSVYVAPKTDTLHIVLQIANFVHSKGGIKKPLSIGLNNDVKLTRQRAEAIDLLLTGCLFMGGLFFLGLYIFGNRDKAVLLFSLYSIVYCYRMIGTDNYVLHTLLPDVSWYIFVRVEYISLFLGIGLFGLYTRYLYPEDSKNMVTNVISVVCFSFAFISVFLPPIYFTDLINPFLLLMVFCLVYIPWVYIRAYKHGRPGSVYALTSSIALMSVFAISLFHYWGFIGQWQIFSFLGYVSFFFLQSLVLSHRVSFELKKARAQAEQGLIAKSEFLSTMSHEIRTPLNSVIGMSHLLLKNNPRPDQLEQLDAMVFSANNLLGIVNDILDYNKIEAGKIAFEHIEMDIVSLTRNVVGSMNTTAQDKGIGLKLMVDDALKNKLYGDPIRTTQVITNLVHNAIKFTEKGYVHVAIDVIGQTEKTITLSIQVKDTGIGISKAKQELIFERFTQADSSTSRGFGGTGLGLAISKRILDLQNSNLQVVSDEGKGSTFYFIQTFEKSTKTLDRPKPQSDLPIKNEKPLTGVNILLVEDNPINVMVAQTFLQRWGASIDVAVNGVEALNKLDTAKHSLVLMDLHMPIMDGYEASKTMRANGVTIPIIALTANLPKEIEEQIKQTGINDVVVKPFLPDELYRKVLLYLD